MIRTLQILECLWNAEHVGCFRLQVSVSTVSFIVSVGLWESSGKKGTSTSHIPNLAREKWEYIPHHHHHHHSSSSSSLSSSSSSSSFSSPCFHYSMLYQDHVRRTAWVVSTVSKTVQVQIAGLGLCPGIEMSSGLDLYKVVWICPVPTSDNKDPKADS